MSASGTQGAGGSPPAPWRLAGAFLAVAAAVAVAFAAAAAAVAPAPALASAPDWADATPTAWHQLARAESLLSAPEPPNPVAVCIVDSGVNITPDLEGVVIERLAYDGGDPGDTYPQDGIDDGHGTYVATFLAGQVNGWGGAGLWPRAKIVSVRVFPPGAKRARAADYLRGLDICDQRSAHVINLSLNDLQATSDQLAEIADRIALLREHKDVNVVVAAGNRGGGVEFPARVSAAFSVAAVDRAGEHCTFSARGAEVDLYAPGCSLAGADQHGQPVVFSGTSFAAPMVSAAITAIRGFTGADADAAEARLLESAAIASAGRMLDVENALTPHSLGFTKQADAPIGNNTQPFSETSATVRFDDYAPPRLRVTKHRESRSRVTILNRPRGAAIEVRAAGQTREFARRAFWIAHAGERVVRLRFISETGFSSWRRVKFARR